jgi:hypothetical protein
VCIGHTVQLEGTVASLCWCLVCVLLHKSLSVQQTTGCLIGMYCYNYQAELMSYTEPYCGGNSSIKTQSTLHYITISLKN